MMYTVVPPIEGRKICAGGGKRSRGGPGTKTKKGGPARAIIGSHALGPPCHTKRKKGGPARVIV